MFFGVALNGEERLLSGQGEEEGSELEPGPYRNEWLRWLHAVHRILLEFFKCRVGLLADSADCDV